MNFEQLTYFIAIVENDTYFNAAEYLHMSQSNLSKQIIKLENELAIDLFDRSYRSAVLTDAGRLFYNDALQLIDQYHKVLQHIDDYKKSNEQNLHIGTLPIQTQYNLTSIFNRFKNQNPNIHISIDEVEEYDLIIGLNQDKYDIIIARENMINSKQYDTYPIAEDELVVVLPSSHKLAAHSTLDFNLLSGENFILMNPYTSIYKLCMQQIKKYNIDANIVGTARTESIIGAVSFNEGISLLPKSNFEIFNHKNVVNIPFTNPIRLSVVIAKKNTRVTTPALKKLIEFI
ncbi:MULTISPECIES: LysR family transcriptional regulator [Clostridium]|uniref:LysR family transcriptional regulator n=1 Tax=Clostridium TaxID=1485 RepID=UPI00040E72C2|nr:MULTISPECIES: LysR family transcriptional regulator [Clostridium]AXB87287.1 LysR family transcriptional regulator [Clostridium butyricum]KIU05184.1 LysR substrate binding domain [Clostridium butyricum]MBA8969175.1 DNA-binding transcriptional LysR family regulator [Clostridium butyricum]MBA8972967.1 DNA-binding transcriptional LysR family regulator [Clostridium butyricum]MBC2425817.1 LysR family transcriptional regulator [Clostridium butyricum]